MKYLVRLDDFSVVVGSTDMELVVYKYGFLKYRKPVQTLVNKKHYCILDNVNGKAVRKWIDVIPLINDHTFDEYPDGTRLKNSQDIKVGDLVIGEDGTPRRVNKLHSGEEQMYKLTIDDEELVVNENHILALVDKETGEKINMPVNVFMLMDDDFKSKVCMEKV